jgi:DinB family protein
MPIEASQGAIDEYVWVLTETPKLLAEVGRLDAGRLIYKATKEDWSAVDVMAHLRACGDVWGKHISRMLAEDTPTLTYESPRTYIRRTNYLNLSFGELLSPYLSQRADLLDVLSALAFGDWSRGSTVNGRLFTVFIRVRQMAHHELEHAAQIKTFLND